MKAWLLAAAGYNIVWGAVVILAPNALFDWAGMELPRYPEIWQCVGMIVGVYGIGYAIAAFDPLRHWPIVLVGLLGKILGPIGFLLALVQAVFPLRFAMTILTNDLIWWVPFAGILWAAMARAQRPVDETVLEASGVRPVLVHLGTESQARPLFERYGLGDVTRVSDPQARLYRSLGLSRGSIGQLFGLQSWTRGFRAAILRRHGVGKLAGDGFQMPGAFVIRDGHIERAFVHRYSSDRPDYARLATGEGSTRT